MLTYGIPPEFRGGVRLFIYAVGSVPSLSGHAIAYRWCSLPGARRHRASKPQGSSEQVLPWQVTMDQLICAFLSHTHYWYEVGMLEVPAKLMINRTTRGRAPQTALSDDYKQHRTTVESCSLPTNREDTKPLSPKENRGRDSGGLCREILFLYTIL